MERSGSDSRASGWNCQFIEQQFGLYVADRLRSALQNYGASSSQRLKRQRPADQRNTFKVIWQLGLAARSTPEPRMMLGRASSAEDEAELAARYVPIQLNGFPSMAGGARRHSPKGRKRSTRGRTSLSLREPESDSNVTLRLQDVRHAIPRRCAAVYSSHQGLARRPSVGPPRRGCGASAARQPTHRHPDAIRRPGSARQSGPYSGQTSCTRVR